VDPWGEVGMGDGLNCERVRVRKGRGVVFSRSRLLGRSRLGLGVVGWLACLRLVGVSVPTS
jgi:hypothetical protein